MKSIATTSPMPSATRVAQLIGAPEALEVSCSRSSGPVPSGTTMPKLSAVHTSRLIEASTVIAVWITAV